MSDEQKETNGEGEGKRTITEELEVAGNKAVDMIKDIISKGNVRRLIIRSPSGKVLYDTTLTTSVGLGGAVVLLGGLPLMVIAGIVAAVSRVKIEVIREVTDDDEVIEGKKKVDIDVDET